jgi:hypothetical protein
MHYYCFLTRLNLNLLLDAIRIDGLTVLNERGQRRKLAFRIYKDFREDVRGKLQNDRSHIYSSLVCRAKSVKMSGNKRAESRAAYLSYNWKSQI